MSVDQVGGTGLESPETVRDYRRRLMEGMAAAVAEKCYAETTIADVVRHARVSKRTFYQHFPAKEECLLALYAAASERVIQAITEAVSAAPDVEAQIAAATEIYLARMQAQPVLTRTLFIEILAAGPGGLAVRHEINQRYAELFRGVADAYRLGAGRAPLSPQLAAAAVGGLNELILQAVLADRVDRLSEDLAAPARALLRAVLAA